MKPSVLIIEDDSTLLRGLTDNFRSQGYSVRSATDGQSGVTAALAEPPDLLLLDIMLPKLNGYEICRRVRAGKLDMPIIMLTAKGQDEEIVRGLDVGADDYVTKPFSIRELLARANAFLRRRIIPKGEPHRFGEFQFDLVSHKLTCAGKEIRLTTKEYRMLAYFVERPNRALSRNDIIDNVWGRSIIVTSRSVDRCITTLRGKIEPDPREPTFIRTIRDVGYRFEIPETASR
jgi:DNA-binding response OmpR family regulator